MSSNRPSPGRRVAVRAIALALALGAFAVVTEVSVRALHLPPRIQVISRAQLSRWTVDVVDGVPLWRIEGSPERRDPECAPGAPEVWLAGDSIFFGVGLAPEQALGAHLQRAIANAGRAACVRDLSQPAYGGLQRVMDVRRELRTGRRPAVVVLEGWESDPSEYMQIDAQWYAVYNVLRDSKGWPAPVLPVPTSLHHAAFRHSQAWAALTLAGAQFDKVADEAANLRWRTEHLPTVVAAVRDAGGRPIVVEVPRLSRPFTASVSAFRSESPERVASAEATTALGVPFVLLAERLVGRDVAPLAQDDCCHITEEGSRVYAEAIAPDVIRELDAHAGRTPLLAPSSTGPAPQPGRADSPHDG